MHTLHEEVKQCYTYSKVDLLARCAGWGVAQLLVGAGDFLYSYLYIIKRLPSK